MYKRVTIVGLPILLAIALFTAHSVVSADDRIVNGVEGSTTNYHSVSQAAPQASPTPDCQPTWSIVDTPDGQPDPIGLYSVAAASSNDVWAVGGTLQNHLDYALIEHWDGNSWQIVSSPVLTNSELGGLKVISSNDVWAVGDAYPYRTLIEHWDGQTWNILPSPSPSSDDHLTKVDGVSATDLWTVGASTTVISGSGILRTLTEHWDGNSWQVIPSPNNGNDSNFLDSVSALSTNDVWAVGRYGINDGPDVYHSLIEHWDGQSWSIIPSPNPLSHYNILDGVKAIAANDVWATGITSDGTNSTTIALHWDGHIWQVVYTPTPGNNSNGLFGVSAVNANDIWAVGDWYSTNPNQTLTEHWDGQQWSAVDSPNVPNAYNFLEAVSTVSSTDVWAVGQIEGGGYTGHLTLAMHYGVPKGCLIPTPTGIPTTSDTPTQTPAIPTNTATASATPTFTPAPNATNTPTSSATPTNTSIATPPQPSATSTPAPPSATPTIAPATTPTDCANPFVDTGTDIFYAAIHQLNCDGVINGTDASHYTPAGTATRGQFAKIVVLGFSLSLVTPSSEPTFTDVLPSYFAYLYIESGYAAHILSGYDPAGCAAVGAIWPCYLPNVPISRAQLTKLVVGAAGYPLLTPAGGPSFTDVPPSNVFYVSIETAHAHGVVNGYPDGTFRPNDNIRRDEMAQIIYIGVTTP